LVAQAGRHTQPKPCGEFFSVQQGGNLALFKKYQR
jgi:hypothetical protein